MKKFILLIIIIYLSFSYKLISQPITIADSIKPIYKGGLSLGITMGIISPQQVNNYIGDKYKDNYDQTKNYIYGNFGVFGSFNYLFNPYMELVGNIEVDLASNTFDLTDTIVFHNFLKLSPGIMFNFHFPFDKNNDKSIFIGFGLTYNSLFFEKFSAITIGNCIKAGYRFNINNNYCDVFISYDNIKANTHQKNDYNNTNMELNYSGIRIGVSMLFPYFK
jgi:hypothetical protein